MIKARSLFVLLPCLLAASVAPAAAQAVFGNPQVFTGGTDSFHRVLAAGDINGDGLTDAAWRVGNGIRYAIGNGNGSFAPPQTVSSGLPTIGPDIASGDLNGDGLMDVVVGSGSGQFIALVAFGDLTEGFDVRPLPHERATGTWPFLADADGDGDLDVYFVSLGVSLWQNDGFGNLVLVEDFDGIVNQQRRSVAVGDLDGDGRADLVMPAIDGDHPGLDIAWIGPRPVTALPAITSISVQPSLLEPGYLVQLADLEGDGDLDIVLHGSSTVTDGPVIQVLRNEGSRIFSALPAVPTVNRVGDFTSDMLVTDLDGDGLQDVVLSCTDAGCRSLIVHHGTGLGALAPLQYLPVLAPARRLLPLDVDCDGDSDLVGGSDSGTVVVLNLGGRSYEDTIYSFIAGRDLLSTSFNGDEDPDLMGVDTAGMEVALGSGCGVGDVRACTLPEPTARAGDDVVGCGQPGDIQDIRLSGIASTGGRPIARYCWSTTNGEFVESGTDFHCSAQIAVTLRLPTIAGRNEAVVDLTVTDFQGCSSQDSVVVATESEPVVQEISVSASTVCQGDTISFIARAADIFSPILTYGWDFDITLDTNGDGDPGNDVDGAVQAVSGGLGVVSHEYPVRGSRTARLIVMGDGQCVATADIDVEVVSAPRITALSGPALTCPGRVGSFLVTQTGGTAPVLYSWDFDTSVDADGNGNPADDSQSSLRNPTWSYPEPGIKTVRATVLAAGGCRDSREIQVFVAEPPEADFTVATPVCGTTVVSFADSSVGDPPLTAIWDFGDGSPVVAGLTATHVFPGPGTYTVTETVRDGGGCTMAVSKSVTIADVDLDLVSSRVFDGQDGTESEGNANGFGEPGETIQLALTAVNRGSDTVTGLTGRIRVISPLSGVTLLDDMAQFPPIDGGGTGTSFAPHLQMRLDETLPCGTSILVEVELLGFGSEACSDSKRFSLTVGLPALARFGNEGPVTSSGGASLRPDAHYGEDHHATVFHQEDEGVSQIYFVRHLFDGPRVLPAVLLSQSANQATAPRLVWSEEQREFGVVWRRIRVDGEARVAFARVSKTGQILGDILELGEAYTGEPDLTWTGSEWVVAWPEGALQPWVPKRLRARILDPEGHPISPTLELSGDEGFHDAVRLASTAGTWLAAYTTRPGQELGGESVLVRTFLAGSVETLSPISERTIVGATADAPSVEVLAGRYLLAWATSTGEVRVATLEPGGGLLTNESAGTAAQPALAAGPDFAVLVYTVNEEVFARGVSQTGALFSRVAAVSGGVGPSVRPTVSASPEGLFMAFWEDQRLVGVLAEEIYGAVLVPIGDPNCTVSGLGDVAPAPNGDGVVNVGDVVLLLRAAVGLEPLTPMLLLRGDVAPGIREGSVHRVIGDGELNVGDVVVLLDVVVGNIQLAPTLDLGP